MRAPMAPCRRREQQQAAPAPISSAPTRIVSPTGVVVPVFASGVALAAAGEPEDGTAT